MFSILKIKNKVDVTLFNPFSENEQFTDAVHFKNKTSLSCNKHNFKNNMIKIVLAKVAP